MTSPAERERDRPAEQSFADRFNARFGGEIPWCHDCKDWHRGAEHTRMRGEQRDAYARGERVFVGDAFGSQSQQAPPRRPPAPDPREKLEAALRVLGLAPDADRLAAREAFRRAIMVAHPDHGGDPEQAKRVLAAKAELERVGRI